MIQQQVFIHNNVRIALDAIGIIAASYLAYYTRYEYSGGLWSMDDFEFSVSVLLVMFANNYTMGRMGLYSEVRPRSIPAMIWAVTKAVVIDFGILAAGVFFLHQVSYPRFFLLLFAGYCLVIISLLRLMDHWYTNHISSRSFHVREILVVGDMARGKFVSELLEKQLSWGHEVIGRLTTGEVHGEEKDILGSIDDLPRILQTRTVDEVVFALAGDRNVKIAKYLDICRNMGIPSRILPALWQPGEHSLSAERMQGVPFLTVPVGNFNATGLLYKRMLDIVGGLIGTLLFLVMYPFIGLAIKLDSPGPILFSQKRIGQNGRIFKIFKFRTMLEDAEARKKELMDKNLMSGHMFKVAEDPRITRVGRWLRKTSLDEFPQFLNVLHGEMSLVGTRPPTLDEVRAYEPWQHRRISAKPGITGLWQVSGRNKITDFNTVVQLDCQYLDNWRFVDDLKIILKTISVVLRRKGAI